MAKPFLAVSKKQDAPERRDNRPKPTNDGVDFKVQIEAKPKSPVPARKNQVTQILDETPLLSTLAQTSPARKTVSVGPEGGHDP